MKLLILSILSSSIVSAQDQPRNERNAAGTLINQDYFTAGQYPETKYLLGSVEAHHLNKRVWADFYAARYTGVLSDVEYTLERFPNHPKALLLLGSVARLTKNISLPIPYYEKALKLYPQYAATYAQYGKYLTDIGQINGGITKLKKAIEIDPRLALSHAWLAEAYYKNGNPELARQASEQAKALGYSGDITWQGSEK